MPANLQVSTHNSPFSPNAFFRAGYIESWGRGIEKIERECQAHGIATPKYEFDKSGLMMTFRANPEHLQKTVRGEKFGGSSVKTRVKTRVKTQVKILQVLAANPRMTLADVAVEIEKSVSAVERASTKLVKEGRLKYVGPQKGGHWEVRGDDL